MAYSVETMNTYLLERYNVLQCNFLADNFKADIARSTDYRMYVFKRWCKKLKSQIINSIKRK